MKYKLCAPIDEDNLYGNGWHNENDDENDDENDTRLECMKCKEQTGYSYPLLALQNAWEHILITEHNVVTILEIVYDRGIIHENKRVKIELIIK